MLWLLYCIIIIIFNIYLPLKKKTIKMYVHSLNKVQIHL